MTRSRTNSFELLASAGSLRLGTRNQGLARPRVKEKSGLPEALEAHFRNMADQQ